MTTNNHIIDGKFKDSSPLATVEKIKAILAEHGIETEVIWKESGVPYCWSNRVNVLGTTFGANGKGLSKEFALASGYGELIERLQIGFIYGPTSLKDGDFAIDDPRYEMRPASELLEKNRILYERLADRLRDTVGLTVTPEQIVNQFATKDGLVSVTSYLDLSTMEKVYFPRVLRKRIFGSNGCAAGNTPEETLVQSVSEIVERYHQIRILKEGLALPEIPDDVLKNYPVSWEIIEFVRNNGYKVSIRDASLNTGFPVVCASIIDCRTGRYHTHFGAYPVFEIALERSLTETFQGRSIGTITSNESFTSKNAAFSLASFYSDLRKSSSDKLPGFFVGESPFTFDPNMGTEHKNNRELLQYCREYFDKLGYSLLVRDCSCLGFPTFQVIVPGYSECYINRIAAKTDDQQYATYAMSTLRDPAKASIPDMLGTLMHLDKVNQFDDMRNFTILVKLPGTASPSRQSYLMSASMAYIYYALRRYSDVVKCVSNMIPLARGENLEYLICLKRYFTMLTEGYTPEYTGRVVDYFHSKRTVARLMEGLSQNNNPLKDFVLHCDMKCDESCILHSECLMKRVNQIKAILDEKNSQLDFDETASYLRSIL